MHIMKASALFAGICLNVYTLSAYALSYDEEKHYQQVVLNEVNHYRMSKGLNKLRLNDKISVEAKRHSLNMATKKESFGHQGFFERINHIKAELSRFSGGAENIACFKIAPKKVVEKWLTSSGHKKNIESKATLTGIGIAQDAKGWIYYTQIFVNDR